ncbi:MAG: NAD(P)H-flavin reductase [Pseudonocardiales bacterium]|nr:NAD(P)H-flavin reductase [Pseudonocardiales bacterium]
MGVRSVLRRWLMGSEERHRASPVDPAAQRVAPDDQSGWTGSFTSPPVGDVPPHRPDVGARPSPVPADGGGRPAAPPIAAPGELVVGNVERRIPPLDLPEFYVAQAPPPPPEPLFPVGQTDFDPALVREAFSFVSDRADRLVADFYAELFFRVKEAPMMFPSSMTRQRQEFGRAVVQWIVDDNPAGLTAHLEQLGDDHRKFNVEPRHYEVAGAAMVSAWKRLAGDKWTDAHEAAIVGSYTRLASTMIDGAMRHSSEPASWGAQIVDHQRLSADFAVLRIQPDAPYPYKAGQYLTLELPAHRREWRSMSIASAPRHDNAFDIQVRAIGASGVSAALVAHTHVGDRLTLGPPRGNDLVVEPGTAPEGLLCVAAGTGAAPITAVVESVLGWPQPPRLYTFVGSRTREDIYSVERMSKLIHAGGYWLNAEVHAVLSDDPTSDGYHGRVEDLVPRLRDWATLGVDVLVAGPDSMIATTVSELADCGVPRDKIHFDRFEMAS